MLNMHVMHIIKNGPKRVCRKGSTEKHYWAEKDWAENKSGPKSDQPFKIVMACHAYQYMYKNVPHVDTMWVDQAPIQCIYRYTMEYLLSTNVHEIIVINAISWNSAQGIIIQTTSVHSVCVKVIENVTPIWQ